MDGKGVGDVGDLVLRDRRRLACDGIVIVLMAVDEKRGEIIYGPDIISRGFVFEDSSGDMLGEAKALVLEVVENIDSTALVDWTGLGPEIKRRLKKFFFRVIERTPMILPVIMPV